MRSVIWRLACVIVAAGTTAHAGEGRLSLIPRGIFTTVSEVFPSPTSPDLIKRGRSYSVENFFGAGLEIRWTFTDLDLAAGISADYLRSTAPAPVPDLPAGLSAEDGFEAIPVELTGLFTLPLSGERFSVFLGGGAGLYLGRRILLVGGVEAERLNFQTGFGIHVLGGVGYRLTDWLSITAEMKFRDVQFDAAARLPASAVTSDGRIIMLPRDTIVSRVHIDGMLVQVGTAFTL